VADWSWELLTDDLLDGLPTEAVQALCLLAGELAVRKSMVFLDGPASPAIRPDCEPPSGVS